MSILKERVVLRLQQLGLSQAELARRAGVSAGYIADIVTGRKATLRSNRLFQVAAALRVRPEYLTGATSTPGLISIASTGPLADDPPDHDEHRSPEGQTRLHSPLGASGAVPARLLRPFLSKATVTEWSEILRPEAGPCLPVFAAGETGLVVVGDHPYARVRTPPALVDVDGAYAVIVPDDRMAPRYLRGELVYLHPNRSLRDALWVVIAQGADEGRLELQIHRIVAYPKHGIHVTIEHATELKYVPYEGIRAIHPIVLAGVDTTE